VSDFVRKTLNTPRARATLLQAKSALSCATNSPRATRIRISDLISHVLPFGRLAYGEPNASYFAIKNSAPHTDGVKGGCSPQNTTVLNQRPAHDNQAFAGSSRDTLAVIRNPSFEGANQSKDGETRPEAKSAPGHQCPSNYAQFNSRSHDAVIRVYDATGNVIETHEHNGNFKEP
jgi:hypothetical protein